MRKTRKSSRLSGLERDSAKPRPWRLATAKPEKVCPVQLCARLPLPAGRTRRPGRHQTPNPTLSRQVRPKGWGTEGCSSSGRKRGASPHLWRLHHRGGFRFRSSADYGCVWPLEFVTIRLETLTGSKSERVRLIRHARSWSFQRASGVPINPPLSPLSARMMP